MYAFQLIRVAEPRPRRLVVLASQPVHTRQRWLVRCHSVSNTVVPEHAEDLSLNIGHTQSSIRTVSTGYFAYCMHILLRPNALILGWCINYHYVRRCDDSIRPQRLRFYRTC